MTVAATTTFEFDIDQLVMLAAQLAGLQTAGAPASGVQWERLSAQGRQFLELEIDALQSENVVTRAVEFYTLTCVAGTSSYTLPATTISLIGNGMYTPPASGSSQTPVMPMDRERYQAVTDKTSQSTPTSYYVMGSSPQIVYLWPVPDAAGTIVFQRYKLLADNNDGAATPDLERYWAKYLTFAVAHMMAIAGGIDPSKCGYLRSNAEKALSTAKLRSAQNTSGQAVCEHKTSWS